jgi:hypothetical protein
MADLRLGPLLRYVDDRRATVWVETDAAAEVEVLGHRRPTFAVEGHHYAVVVVEGLEPGQEHAYEVHVDGERRWPPPGWPLPPSVIRTADPSRPLRIAFGSCRVAAPHEPPETLDPEDHPLGYGIDALRAYGLRLAGRPTSDPPDLLVLAGDQVYADEAAPGTRRRVRERSTGSTERPPDDQVGDFEEYTWLYHEAWSEPVVRWLLSTVPSTMIFDDHDLIDDWNTSAEWRSDMGRRSWWPEREIGGLMAYWLYQHVGNLTPDELDADPRLARLHAGEGDHLRAAMAAARLPDGTERWSFGRDVTGSGRVRLVTVDVRNSRDLTDGGRAIVDADRWRWIDGQLVGGADHLVVVASLPWLLPGGVADIERWDEALCAGAWGRLGRRLGERLRRQADLEHWPAYVRSFRQLTEAVLAVARGERGPAPAAVLVLSGDVHFSYVAPVGAEPGRAPVVQVVSSPLRSRVSTSMRRQLRLANSRLGKRLGRGLVRTVPGRRDPLRWEVTAGPWFGNGIASLVLDRDSAEVRLERVEQGRSGPPELVLQHAAKLV